MKISKTGYWITKKPKHWFDRKMCYFINEFLDNHNIKTLVDFGCGDGSYINYLTSKGLICEGYDGNPFTKEISNGLCEVLDLSAEINLGRKFDCVLSLETGEHIPKEYEQKFIDNIAKHSDKYIILSWAVPNQGGEGHFNERENTYIINEFEKRNFKIMRKETIELRKNSSIDWFKYTIMIYENNGINNNKK